MSASTRPTPSPNGPGSACRPKRNGRSRPRMLPLAGNFADSRHLHPCADGTASPTPDAPALRQMFGDVWEWTASPYIPYPRFRAGRGRGRRIQRQVHVQPDGAARRRRGDPGRPHPRHLPQLLPALGALGVCRAAAGGGSWMMNGARFAFHDLAPGEESFRDAVLHGLGGARKSIPCKFFYDARGSALFEEICRLAGVLSDPHRDRDPRRKRRRDRRRRSAPHCRLIEFGSGASHKVRILLQALDRPGGLCPGRHLARASARRRRQPRRGFPVGCRSSRSAPTIPGRFRCRRCPARRASGSAFSRDRRSATSSPSRSRRFLANLRRFSGPAARC